MVVWSIIRQTTRAVRCLCAIAAAVAARHWPMSTNTIIPRAITHSNYYAAVDAETCTACETCVERCQVKAVQMESNVSVITKDRCIGCGLCASTSPHRINDDGPKANRRNGGFFRKSGPLSSGVMQILGIFLHPKMKQDMVLSPASDTQPLPAFHGRGVLFRISRSNAPIRSRCTRGYEKHYSCTGRPHEM